MEFSRNQINTNVQSLDALNVFFYLLKTFSSKRKKNKQVNYVIVHLHFPFWHIRSIFFSGLDSDLFIISNFVSRWIINSCHFGHREGSSLEEVVEKQADLIEYLKQHNTLLSKRLLNLTAQHWLLRLGPATVLFNFLKFPGKKKKTFRTLSAF